jgi:8-oxo-dGTP diphosphatase
VTSAAPASRVVRVSAAIIVDAAGRALVVRKRGTTRFMQPGGKPERGETPAEALARELAEEVGLIVDAAELRALGVFTADAANEPGHTVIADVFALSAEPGDVSAQAEIEELLWITADTASALPLAPLSRDLLPSFAWA